MSELSKTQKKAVEVVLRTKMYLNRAYGHISLPVNIFQNVMLVFLFLKTLEIENVVAWSIVLNICLVAFMLVLGYLDVRFGIFRLENSINNAHNEELLRAARLKK